MKILHLLSESEADAFFYERIAERVTGFRFSRVPIRLRKGAGHRQVIASIKLLLSQFPKNTPRPDCAILVSVDNDRCPDHPGAKSYPKRLTSAEKRRPSRWLTIQDAMNARWGVYRGSWPVNVAVAVPVEMIESWQLLLLNPKRGKLPVYSRQEDRTAIAYHHPLAPGPQLKDLVQEEASQRKMDKQELLMLAAEADLEPALKASLSFRIFVADLQNWKP